MDLLACFAHHIKIIEKNDKAEHICPQCGQVVETKIFIILAQKNSKKVYSCFVHFKKSCLRKYLYFNHFLLYKEILYIFAVNSNGHYFFWDESLDFVEDITLQNVINPQNKLLFIHLESFMENRFNHFEKETKPPPVKYISVNYNIRFKIPYEPLIFLTAIGIPLIIISILILIK